jgi:AraC-like DNA-binding protein
MDVAKVLLETTFLSVKEVAAKSGFNDLSHFVRDFKKMNGLTPTDHRMQSVATIWAEHEM